MFNHQNIILTLTLLLYSQLIFAQNEKNPFDIDRAAINKSEKPTEIPTINKVKKDSINISSTPIKSTAKESINTDTVSTGEHNPLDIYRSGAPKKAVVSEPSIINKPSKEKVVVPKENEIEIKEKAPPPTKKTYATSLKDLSTFKWFTGWPKLKNHAYLFGVYIITLLVIILVNNFNRKIFETIYRCFMNDNFLKLSHREYRKGSNNVPYFLLYGLFFMNLGIFIHYVLQQYQITFVPFYVLAIVISVIWLLKHTFLQIIGNLFPPALEMNQYSFAILVFNIILFIILFPINILLTYGPEFLQQSLIYVGLITFGAVHFFRQIRVFIMALRRIVFHKFHFLLYFCTLEMAPVLISLKILGFLN